MSVPPSRIGQPSAEPRVAGSNPIPSRIGQTWLVNGHLLTVTKEPVPSLTSSLGRAWNHPAFCTETGLESVVLEFESEPMEALARNCPQFCRRVA